MSMVEDKKGIIWAALRPNCRLISFNPKTKEITDYGIIYKQKSTQQCRSIVAGKGGWIYITAGSPGNEIVVAFSSKTEKSHVVQTKKINSPRKLSLLSGQNGKVFVKSKGNIELALQNGEKKAIIPKRSMLLKKETKQPAFVTGNQSLFDRVFPDGKRIMDWISSVTPGFLRSHTVTIKNPKTNQKSQITLDYKTEGAVITGIATSPNGLIIGGSTFPMFYFRYNSENGQWTRYKSYGQYNTFAIRNDQIFIGSYPKGELLKWNTNKKRIHIRKVSKKANPQILANGFPYIKRPLDLLVYPNSGIVVMGGRPTISKMGGGLLFWNTQSKTAEILKHISTLSNQSTKSLVALSSDRILGGTTIKPGESGQVTEAKEAVLYILDLKKRDVVWSGAVIPGARNYQDLCMAPNGLVMGVAETHIFFVFDPEKHQVLQRVNLKKAFGSQIPYMQGQRSFIKSPEGKIYLLLRKGILQVNPVKFKLTLLAKAPIKISAGGAYLNGRIYFVGKIPISIVLIYRKRII